MIEVTEHTIDIDALLKSKLGDKARFVPRFLVRYLKKIIHEDQVNASIWRMRNLEGVPWADAGLKEVSVSMRVIGEENLPDANDGKRYTFVSNHPLGGPDGLIYAKLLGEKYNGNIRLLVNDLLMNLPGLAPLCVPVNIVGKQNRELPRILDEAFASDNNMFVFPAGLCSRSINGEVHDLPWHKTFMQKSIQHKRDVVPLYLEGQNSKRFYRIANICKALHSPVNVAMLYLVDELYKHVGKTFTVRVGKPIPWQTFDKSKTTQQWALWVEDKVYELKNN